MGEFEEVNGATERSMGLLVTSLGVCERPLGVSVRSLGVFEKLM